MRFCFKALASSTWREIHQVVVHIGASSISRKQVDVWSADIEVINIIPKNTL